MKQLFLKTLLLIPGILLLSGCYTKLAEPVTREEYYLEQDTTQYTEQDESYENYMLDSPNLSEYNQGYRDAYREFLNSNLWYGYNPYSSFYHHNPYWYSHWSSYHSYYLGYYDPFFYDPFYDWGYYSYGYYNPYRYRNFGYYHDPYSRYYYSHGYYYHGGGYYYGGYTSSQTISEGRQQKKVDRQPKIKSPPGNQLSRIPNDLNSDFQTSLDLPMSAGSGSMGSSGTSNDNYPPIVSKPFNPGNSKEVIRKRPTKEMIKSDATIPGIPGFQNKLLPPPSIGSEVKRYPSSKPGIKRTGSPAPKPKPNINKETKPATKSSLSRKKTISRPTRKSSSGKSSSSSGSSPSYRSPSKSSSSRSSSIRSSSGSKSSSSSSSRSSSSGKSSSSKSSSKSSKSSSKRSK